ncbi:hypothetical protein EOD39_10913 [Acipenser ruthenus]|uniref:Uncharacterized protein n=1 Tax=Acipenser ruthenus TaxID=7906 RepID=A0A444TWM6_ACIRT|nr:hypothetical protein EOD39_10913 [Acipenser ruthenus]
MSMEVESVPVDNLTDFDLIPCGADPCVVDPCTLDPYVLDLCTVDPCVLDSHVLDPCTVDPCVLEPSPPVVNHNGNGHGHGEDPGNDSEATESADSENEALDLPSRSGWSHSRRSSSNESFSSNLSAESAEESRQSAGNS